MSTEMTTRGYLSTALVPSGEQWKKMRRIVSTRDFTCETSVASCKEADHLVDYVDKQCKNNSESGGLVKVRLAAQHYCGNVIRKMVFNKRFFGEGMEDGGPGLEEEEHVNALFKPLAYIFSFCVSDYVPCLRGVVDLDGHEKVMKENIGIIDKYYEDLLDRFERWS
ncbi:hypothetical protein Dsin_028044 [Dipteronia sinensis]|uniref:Cytochrome P450 n=1 Tax=Dipteronia sinensis TaxID=43782 RepID=A0AAE0DTV6_9ROSI|nr:hypothetical protein Dsin_028044 [Dipteronia sinensis]